MALLPKRPLLVVTVALAVLAALILGLGWWRWPGSGPAGADSVVVPTEVDLGELPIGKWVAVTIPVRNPTSRVASLFDVAPT